MRRTPSSSYLFLLAQQSFFFCLSLSLRSLSLLPFVRHSVHCLPSRPPQLTHSTLLPLSFAPSLPSSILHSPSLQSTSCTQSPPLSLPHAHTCTLTLILHRIHSFTHTHYHLLSRSLSLSHPPCLVHVATAGGTRPWLVTTTTLTTSKPS